MNHIVKYIASIEQKVTDIGERYKVMKEEKDILTEENIRLKKVNNQLTKEIEQLKSLNVESVNQMSNNKKSDINIDQFKKELEICIVDLEQCIEKM